jgi:hypothetical protein
MGYLVLKKEDTMVDEIANIASRQIISPAKNLFDKIGGNGKPEKSDKRAVETTTKIVIENSTVIVEQYDRHGKLIRKTPPGYLPPGENG